MLRISLPEHPTGLRCERGTRHYPCTFKASCYLRVSLICVRVCANTVASCLIAFSCASSTVYVCISWLLHLSILFRVGVRHYTLHICYVFFLVFLHFIRPWGCEKISTKTTRFSLNWHASRCHQHRDKIAFLLYLSIPVGVTGVQKLVYRNNCV